MQIFSLLHRGQAKIYRRIQHALIKRVNAALDIDPAYQVSDADRASLAELDNFLNKASGAISKIIDTATKVTESMTTQQLEAQMASEFIRAAKSWTDGEWAVVDEIRAQRDARRAAE